MLPSAKSSLQKAGFSSKAAAWTLIGCFLAGVIGIQIVSRVIHRFMPSHTVDCEHSHDEESGKEDGTDHDHNHDPRDHQERPEQKKRHASSSRSYRPRLHQQRKSAMDQPSYFTDGNGSAYQPTAESERDDPRPPTAARRPSLQARLTSTLKKVTSVPKSVCDGDGPCYGFSEPCGQECFKIVQARGSRSHQSHPLRPTAARSATTNRAMTESTPLLQEIREESSGRQAPALNRPLSESATHGDETAGDAQASSDAFDAESPTLNGSGSQLQKTNTGASSSTHHHAQHHHHVPTNAFMSIGLQTSIAIALHKLPEGFITYATNHANPQLGFSVFLALFIHNITEGFAMALPLYLAINSRWKAMFWSTLLGGFSQPLGAGVAALWFKLAGKGNMAPGEGVYGGMFAVTSGIMASVALQLFSESLDLTHNRGLCMVFAFVGMGILGVSSALTA